MKDPFAFFRVEAPVCCRRAVMAVDECGGRMMGCGL